MKYPFLSNMNTFEPIPIINAYYSKNNLTGKRAIISDNDFRFASSLTGSIDPYLKKDKQEASEIKQRLERLERQGVIRNDHGVIKDAGLGFLKTLVIVRNYPNIEKMASVYNRLLMVLFIPIFIIGGLLYFTADIAVMANYYSSIKIANKHPLAFSWGLCIIGALCGSVLHEISHGLACVGYAGIDHLYEFGVMATLPFPGLYTLMDISKVPTRIQKVQVLAAGIEGNLLLAGLFFAVSGLNPYFGPLLSEMGIVNIILSLVNILPFPNSDGSKIMGYLLGIDDLELVGIEKMKKSLRELVSRKKKKGEVLTGYIKMVACSMFLLFRRTYIVLFVVDILSVVLTIIGAFVL